MPNIPARKGDFSLTPGCQVDQGFTADGVAMVRVHFPGSDKVLVIIPQHQEIIHYDNVVPFSADYDD